jgi:hypothetical protein
VDCKTSICQAVVSQPDLQAHQRFLEGLASSPSTPWQGSSMVTLSDERGPGRITSIAFFAREGQGLTVEEPTVAP